MEENATGQLKKCTYCAEDIPAEAAACPKCGAQLVDGPTEQEYQTMYVPAPGNNGMGFAIASFVLGIMGVIPCCCCVGTLGSVLALVFGFIARSQMKSSGSTQFSWMSTTGIVLGIVGIIFGIIGMVIGLAMSFLQPHGGVFHGGRFPFPIPQ
jgi:hypothetical protein